MLTGSLLRKAQVSEIKVEGNERIATHTVNSVPMNSKDRWLFRRVAKEFPSPLPSSNRAEKNGAERRFRLIQSHSFENDILFLQVKYFHAIQGKIEVNIPFNDLRLDEPVPCAKYIREYVAEDRRGQRPFNTWAGKVLKHEDTQKGKRKMEIFFGTVESNELWEGTRMWRVKYDDEDEEDFDLDQLKKALDLYEQFKELDVRLNNNRGGPDNSTNDKKGKTEEVDTETILQDSCKGAIVSARGKKSKTDKVYTKAILQEPCDVTRSVSEKNTVTKKVDIETILQESCKGTRRSSRGKKAKSDKADTKEVLQESCDVTKSAIEKKLPINKGDTETILQESCKGAVMNSHSKKSKTNKADTTAILQEPYDVTRSDSEKNTMTKKAYSGTILQESCKGIRKNPRGKKAKIDKADMKKCVQESCSQKKFDCHR